MAKYTWSELSGQLRFQIPVLYLLKPKNLQGGIVKTPQVQTLKSSLKAEAC